LTTGEKSALLLAILLVTLATLQYPSTVGAFTSLQSANPSTMIEVPPAVVEPKIDGRYTPLEELQLTSLGKQQAAEYAKEMPSSEWDDAIEVKWTLGTVWGVYLNTQWYSRFKQTDKWLYILTEAPQDYEVGKVTGNKDRRQFLWMVFDRKNTGDLSMGAPGYYWLWFQVISADTVTAGAPPYGLVWHPTMPREYYEWGWSISGSPRFEQPHLMIECAINLGVLTQYASTIRIEFYSSSFDGTSFSIPWNTNLDLTGQHSIAEVRHTVLESLDRATSSIQEAWTDGRTVGLDQAKDTLVRAQATYDAGDYRSATVLANEVKELADAATHSQDYYIASELLVNATKVKSSVPSSFTSQEAENLYKQGANALESAEEAFTDNDFNVAIAYAQNATTLFGKAVSTEEAYKASESQMQMLTYGLGGGLSLLIVAVVAVYLVRRRQSGNAS
jgi:hypothetical protein